MRRASRVPLLIYFVFLTVTGLQALPAHGFNTRGVDMELLSYGGSLGGFFSRHPGEAFSLDLEADWTLVENDDSFTYYNYYNQPISINHRNLSFVKLLAGATWFPFMDKMHPSLQFGLFTAAGPLLALNTADDEQVITRWKAVETDLTVLGRPGVHLRILTGQGGSYNFRIGYDYAAFDQIIDNSRVYQGLFFMAGMEFLNR